MSDPAAPLRIRVQPSPRDPQTLRFLLDAPVQPGAAAARFDGPAADAPLARALFAVPGVRRVEVDGPSIHVQRDPEARWEDMKPPLAAAIRTTLAAAAAPLGAGRADPLDAAADPHGAWAGPDADATHGAGAGAGADAPHGAGAGAHLGPKGRAPHGAGARTRLGADVGAPSDAGGRAAYGAALDAPLVAGAGAPHGAAVAAPRGGPHDLSRGMPHGAGGAAPHGAGLGAPNRAAPGADPGPALGAAPGAVAGGPDALLLARVRDLLERSVNPSIASHGGRIAVERVVDGVVHLRMSGGCQGCAASQLTLRGGVERTLRAALPDLRGIVDVTDHAAGAAPFYADAPDPAASPLAGPPLRRPASRAPGAPPAAKPAPSAQGASPADEGAPTAPGTARAAQDAPTPPGARPADQTRPPPQDARPAAAPLTGEGAALPDRVRRHLAALPASGPTVAYGALARALGLWLPGSVSRITRALEDTMREDARAGRPFVAARAVSRAGPGLPAKGFFDLARALSRGPRDGEPEPAFHARELARLAQTLTQADPRTAGQDDPG